MSNYVIMIITWGVVILISIPCLYNLYINSIYHLWVKDMFYRLISLKKHCTYCGWLYTPESGDGNNTACPTCKVKSFKESESNFYNKR